MPTQEQLKKYAALAVRTGVNLQAGQQLEIRAGIENAPLVREITRVAYEVGASNVYVQWSDDEMTKIRYFDAPEDSFDVFPQWLTARFDQLAEEKTAFLSVVSEDPDLLNGVESSRIARANKAAGVALANWRKFVMSDNVSWCVIAAPSEAWAAKVFPDSERAVEDLWDAILKATRVDQDNPVAAWEQHDANLRTKATFLTEKKYKKLHYTSPGTELTIELPERHVWLGGGGPNADGVDFIANLPTEEVFTLPNKTGVNGHVSSTKPLSYSGNLIDEFTLWFEDGKIVKAEAKQGQAALDELISLDEGARYLGEVALVPHHSPISDSGILFYNTLFDENASCHLAIGRAYSTCLENGPSLSNEELAEQGANDSMTHVDFMIGSAGLSIDGELADGTREPVMREGNWAI
ncbi:aminopeptidase [Exiguobacterium undae]|jgi:aminopeptidase|uniref:Peptidase M29 n=1 Tax=Exiguobacterium undae TaxID=169177 RepID=A0ABX2V7Y6_9BACL|nr:aminopeptidase [Exiguobacterium undae]OAN12271.1 peptidase M29 [Exiguobacterium undae]